ncbi:SecDF P1 head subdomain-containing protein [Actinokineospora sp.]|uniref:SecDF P1 head subdomain-containing protein n=1 Tax=Actinokineospora sp. TaxID=1872133 RepID=UPI003D6A5305
MPKLIVVAGLLLALTACGKESTPTPPPSSQTTQAGSGPVDVNVPVEMRPVLSVDPPAQTPAPAAPDVLTGKDGSTYRVGPSIGDFGRFKDVGVEQVDGRWVLNIELPDDTAAIFAKWTTENVGKQLAIVVDGELVSAPEIASAITGGALQIAGSFTQKEIRELERAITGK